MTDRYLNQRGVVVVLFSMLITALVALAGLAIDTWIVTRLKERQDSFVTQGAQNALQKFIQTSGTRTQKNNAAENTVKRGIKDNISVLEKLFFIDLPSGNPDIQVASDTATGGANGKIVPGIYYTDPPPSCSGQTSPCPCSSGAFTTPCFSPISPTAVASPNSFKAELALAPNSGVKTMFMRMVGMKSVKIKSSAMAARKERHILFMPDLSRSVAQVTHLDYASTGSSNSAEYAFQLPNSASCSGGSSINVNTAFAMQGGLIPNYYEFLWSNVSKTRSGNSAATKHYRDDYRCYHARYKINGGSNINDRYVIDRYRGTISGGGGNYVGPQPLSDILQAMNFGMTEIQNDAYPGDKVGLLAFDHTADIDDREMALKQPTDTEYTDLMDVTDVANQTNTKIKNRLEKYMLFPRTDAMSNIPAALEHALEIFQADANYKRAEKAVIIFTDGLSNCMLDGTCGTDEATVQSSISDIQTLLTGEFKRERIAVHLVLVGPRSGAHSLLERSFQHADRCIDADEAAEHSPPLSTSDDTVGSNDFNNMLSGSGNYYGVFSLQDALRQTGGALWPVRDCCKASGACSDIRSNLDSACASHSAGQPFQNSPYTDANGRLLCDPEGRDQISQLNDTISRILDGMNDFVLVDRD